MSYRNIGICVSELGPLNLVFPPLKFRTLARNVRITKYAMVLGPPYISPVRQCLRYIRMQDYSRNSRITGTQTSLTTSLIQRIPPPNIRIVESGEAFRSPNHTADNVQITQPPLGILVDRRTSRNWLKTS